MVERMGIVTMLHYVLAAYVATGDVSTAAWKYESQTDPLGQTVHVAQIAPEEARPFVAMRLMCGGISGVMLQVNLGEMQSALMTSPVVGLSFSFNSDVADCSAAASIAPVVDGVGTYEIKGSEA